MAETNGRSEAMELHWWGGNAQLWMIFLDKNIIISTSDALDNWTRTAFTKCQVEKFHSTLQILALKNPGKDRDMF